MTEQLTYEELVELVRVLWFEDELGKCHLCGEPRPWRAHARRPKDVVHREDCIVLRLPEAVRHS